MNRRMNKIIKFRVILVVAATVIGIAVYFLMNLLTGGSTLAVVLAPAVAMVAHIVLHDWFVRESWLTEDK